MYWFALLNRLSKEWVVVSKDEAQQNTYFGFRGWLLLLYVLTVVSVIQTLIAAFSSLDPLVVEGFGGNTVATRSIYIAQGIVWVPFLVLAPLKHPLTPRVWIGCAWISGIAFVATINMPGQIDAMIGWIAFVVVITLLLTWYALHSKRVNVTYLSRVLAGEPNLHVPSDRPNRT